MKQEAFFKFHQELCDMARAITKAKNNDYSAPGERKADDEFAVFANFMQAERLNLCTVEQGFMVRISDKISRLCNLLKPGHTQTVTDESIRDTALDTINYLILMLGYMETKKQRLFELPGAAPERAVPAPTESSPAGGPLQNQIPVGIAGLQCPTCRGALFHPVPDFPGGILGPRVSCDFCGKVLTVSGVVVQ